MKCAGKNINLKNVKASVFGKTTDLVLTKSGHHAVSLTVLYQIIHIQNSSKVNETSLHSNDNKEQMARKLWYRFDHAPRDKLLKLVPLAGQSWSTDSELKEKIKIVFKYCLMIYSKF